MAVCKMAGYYTALKEYYLCATGMMAQRPIGETGGGPRGGGILGWVAAVRACMGVVSVGAPASVQRRSNRPPRAPSRPRVTND